MSRRRRAPFGGAQRADKMSALMTPRRFFKESNVGHSICFLTASLLAAQTPQGGVTYQTQYQQKAGCSCQQGAGNGNATFSSAPSESFPRVRGLDARSLAARA